jgi:hypothetical protein
MLLAQHISAIIMPIVSLFIIQDARSNKIKIVVLYLFDLLLGTFILK